MSNPFAIAAVTTTFGQLLGLVTEEPTLAGATVTTRAPDRARTASTTARQLNLFLYGLTPNASWRNADLAFRDAEGNLVNRPTLALTMHYLLTAFGENDDDLDAHHLLAHAMSLAHDNATLTRDQIRAAIGAQPAVAQSDLADQVELVKIAPHPLAPDDLYKLWSTFQTPYRLSVAYEASVVLLQRPLQARAALPVRAATLTVLPFRRPQITSLVPQALPAGSTLTIAGYNLRANGTGIRFSTGTVPPATLTDQQITVPLPADLQAGVHTVQVVQSLALGQPSTSHQGFESNVAAFLLLPAITTPAPISVARGASLPLAVTPPIGRAQDVTLLVGDATIPLPPRPAGDPPATSVQFPIPADLPTGTSPLRLRVDGVESALTVDADPQSPTFNHYIGPAVTIQ